jgi:hypothetical protein
LATFKISAWGVTLAPILMVLLSFVLPHPTNTVAMTATVNKIVISFFIIILLL